VSVGNWNHEDNWNGPEGFKVPSNRTVGDEFWSFLQTSGHAP